MTLALVVIAALLLFWGLGAYNRLMRLRNAVSSAWQQLDAPLSRLAAEGQKLADAASHGLPQEGSAVDALRATSLELLAAIKTVQPAPYAAESVSKLAVAHALQAAALQRVLALAEHAPDEAGSPLAPLVASLREAQQQREFGKQLFNQRVLVFNEALAEVPTRALAGLYGFHDAQRF